MHKINLDDPRLTAYALGELDDAERAALEAEFGAELEESPEARQEFERVREFAARLSVELKAELNGQAPGGVSSLALSATQRAEVEAAAQGAPLAASSRAASVSERSSWTPARIVAACATAAAVTVAVTLLLVSRLNDGDSDEDAISKHMTAGSPQLSSQNEKQPPADRSWGRAWMHQEKGFSDGANGAAGNPATGAQSPGTTKGTGLPRDYGTVGAGAAAGPSSAGRSGTPGAAGPGGPIAPGAGGYPGAPPAKGYSPQTTPSATTGLSAPDVFSADLESVVEGTNHGRGEALLQLHEQEEAGLAAEAYEQIIENDFLSPRQQPLSTFSIDVDTASYSNVRRFLKHDQWPPAAAVRIEELVNYFQYDYAPPAEEEEEEPGADATGSENKTDSVPFAVHLEVAACPWNTDHRLARVAIKGREIPKDKRPISNLVFLIDVSGSMQDANKLPLVQAGLELLVGEMTENDRIAIVTYAGDSRLVLPSTGGDKKDVILAAIRGLSAGGSTNGAGGIQLAYETAVANFKENGANRVLVCTDGDFNVGISDDNQLVHLIEEKRKSGVFLSVFGFGMGNLKDAKLEKLADKGNGHYGYIDDLREAKKLFVEEFSGTMYTIAKDVKLQVEFNPAQVGAYRLIGYENRALAAKDFRDDTKDAGEIGAGHAVTALYEIVPVDKLGKDTGGRKLKYQKEEEEEEKEEGEEAEKKRLEQEEAEGTEEEGEDKEGKKEFAGELFTLWLRYKQPTAATSTELEFPVTDNPDKGAMPSQEFEWAASVAAFGMILRDSKHKGAADFDLLLELALGSKGPDANGYRREFIDLMFAARVIDARLKGLPTPTPPEIPDDLAQAKATAEGKYANLLKKLPVPSDFPAYAAFTDFGYWEGKEYAGQQDLPKGHWVYVYPNWYIWGEAK